MKREFLESIEVGGVKLPAEVIDSIMKEHGNSVNGTKATLAAKIQELETMTTERDGLKTQISDRDRDIEDLRRQIGDSDELNGKLTKLQNKYNTDTAALQKQLTEQALSFATDKFFGQFEFASELAKKAAIADFKAQKFKFDEGTGNFLGGKEWIDNLKQSDPAAFKVTQQNNNGDGGNQNLPFFVASTGGNSSANGGKGGFDFGFAGVRERPKD